MANHSRQKREKSSRQEHPTLVAVPVQKAADAVPLRQPLASDPASWTLDFCLAMAKLSREDQNPLPAHVWTTRGYVIAFELERKKKHPFAGMPVNEFGEAIPTPPVVISGDWKTELLGAFTSEVESVKHSDL